MFVWDKLADSPMGSDIVRVTLPEKPFKPVTLTVELIEEPLDTVRVRGFALATK